jgi:hypothetical protein
LYPGDCWSRGRTSHVLLPVITIHIPGTRMRRCPVTDGVLTFAPRGLTLSHCTGALCRSCTESSMAVLSFHYSCNNISSPYLRKMAPRLILRALPPVLGTVFFFFFCARAASAMLGQRRRQNVFNKRYWYLNFVGGWIAIREVKGGGLWADLSGMGLGRGISWLWIFMKFLEGSHGAKSGAETVCLNGTEFLRSFDVFQTGIVRPKQKGRGLDWVCLRDPTE